MKRLLVILGLLLFAGLIQAWTTTHATVPAQDAVRYVGIAQAIEQDGLIATLSDETEHPLFPILVWLTSRLLRTTIGEPDHFWALSVQTAATLALLASVVVVFAWLSRMVGQSAAVIGTLYYTVIGELARLGADGLSDSTALLFFSLALLGLSFYWRAAPVEAAASMIGPSAKIPTPGSGAAVVGGRSGWLLLTGVVTSIALLARSEAVMILPAVAIALVAFQMVPAWRQSWRRLATAGLCLLAGVGLVLVPHLMASSAISPPAAASRLLGHAPVSSSAESSTHNGAGKPKTSSWRLADGSRMSFGRKERTVSSRFSGYASAAAEFLRELPGAFHYWIGGLAIVGLWHGRPGGFRRIDYFCLAFSVLYSAAAIHVAARWGYLSTRHLLPLVIIGLAPASIGTLVAGRWLADWAQRSWARSRLLGRLTQPTVAAAVVTLVCVAACLPRTLAPLHHSRGGHREAAAWLASRQTPAGLVLDTRGWTGLYSGRLTHGYDQAKAAFRNTNLAFVVLEQRELEWQSPRALTLGHLLDGAAERVAEFAAPSGDASDKVVVFRWHPERFTRQLSTPVLAN